MILSECIERESRRKGLGGFLADQQAGIPLGGAGDRQSDTGMGVGARAVGMAVGTGGKSHLKPPPLQETTEGEWLWLTI